VPDPAASAVAGHYGRPDIAATILAALAAAGKNLERLTPDDLAPLDEFHTRGRAATADLARLLRLTGGERVLDVGCGIGGPSRYLAHTFGCRVTGLDLTPEFCAAAATLAERMALTAKVDYRQGNALAMPFPDGSFDVAWSQNVVMNIAARDALYAEIRRALRPGGRYAFSDVVAGTAGPLHFPVPWAEDPSISFLLTAPQTRAALERAGFRVAVFEDQSADALVQQRRRVAMPPDALGLHVWLGPDFPAKQQNTRRNLEEGRIGLIQGVAERVG
jgi:SAM-dependent methyltransferase